MTCATYAADSDNAERYVLGQMEEAEQASFEEHFFGCDSCFASVQTLQQMQTALRDGAGPSRAESAPAAVSAPATVVTFPKRGIGGIDAKWWGLAVAATLLLTTCGGRGAVSIPRPIRRRPWRATRSRRRSRLPIRRRRTRRPAPNRPASNHLTDSLASKVPECAKPRSRHHHRRHHAPEPVRPMRGLEALAVVDASAVRAAADPRLEQQSRRSRSRPR